MATSIRSESLALGLGALCMTGLPAISVPLAADEAVAGNSATEEVVAAPGDEGQPDQRL